jgi:hypothetical protein
LQFLASKVRPPFCPACIATLQVDLHYGELTVRETFEFAAECQSRGYQRGMLSELVAREEQAGVTPDPELDAFMKVGQQGGALNMQTRLWKQTLMWSNILGSHACHCGWCSLRACSRVVHGLPFSLQAEAFGGSHSLNVELMLHMLGLQICSDTVVGNHMLRGISGG